MTSLQNAPRYTKDNARLTIFQRGFYERHGYIVIPGLVPEEILKKCDQRFDDVVSRKVKDEEIVVMYDVKDRKSVNKLQDINRDVVFREYIEYSKLLDIVEAVTGPNIMAVHSMLIAKPPDSGYGTSKHPPHQDLYYFPFRPADLVVAAWTAMEPCTVQNGCLHVAPGSHRLDELFAHDYPPGAEAGTVNKFYHGILNPPENLKWVDLEMQPGDTVFFHPLLIHGSGVNKTNRSRRSISCHYASSECDYIDISSTVQRSISDEIMSHVNTKFPGLNMTYSDIWRLKSTLVRGIRSSL